MVPPLHVMSKPTPLRRIASITLQGNPEQPEALTSMIKLLSAA